MNETPTTSRVRRPAVTAGICVLLSLVFDSVAMYFIAQVFSLVLVFEHAAPHVFGVPWVMGIGEGLLGAAQYPSELSGIAFGVLFGQLGAMIVLTSLTGRTWLTGLFSAVGLAWACLGAVFLGAAIATGDWTEVKWESLKIPAAGLSIPAAVLAMMSPLLALRVFRGWRVRRSNEPIPIRPMVSIADWLVAIFIVGSALNLLCQPHILLEEPAPDRVEWRETALQLGLLFAASLTLGPLSAWLTLTIRSRLICWLGAGVIAVSVTALLVATKAGFESSAWSWRQVSESGYGCATVVLPAVIAAFGILRWFRWSGLRLVLLPRGSSEAPQAAAGLKHARLDRWQRAFAFIVVIGVSLSLQWLQAWRRIRDAEIARLTRIAERTGGDLTAHDREVVLSVRLGKNGTDVDLAEFRACRLESLHLSGTGFTDRGIQSIDTFRGLEYLQLSDTAITDEGLRNSSQLSGLRQLDVQGGQVTGSALQALGSDSRLAFLSLTDIPVTEESFAALSACGSLRYVHLDGIPVTRRSMQAIGNIPNLGWLHIRNTCVATEAGTRWPMLFEIDLAGSDIGDDQLASWPLDTPLGVLDLARTPITDRTLRRIAGNPALMALDVSFTEISDVGLSELGSLDGLNHLSLSHTRVTGAGFQAWPRTKRVNDLDLSFTHLTDANLRHLQRVATGHIDLQGTSVSVQGILRAGFKPTVTMTVAPNQFSEVDMARLKQAVELRLGEERG